MQEKIRIAITTYIHFLVDFACAYWMFRITFRQYNPFVSCPVGEILVDNDNRLVLFLVYNFCAFALQLPLGWMVDRFFQKRPWWVSSLGCLLLAVTGGLVYGEIALDALHRGGVGNIGFYYSDLHILVYAILLGIGNALFHVGAGVEILHFSAQGGKMHRCRRGESAAAGHKGCRMTPVGIFVSSGALGLFVGEVIASHLGTFTEAISDYFQVLRVISLVIIGLMLAAAWLNLLVTRSVNPYHREAEHVRPAGYSVAMSGKLGRLHETDQRDNWAVCDPAWHTGIILLLFLVVVLRSFQGGVMKFPWYSWPENAIIFTLCVTLGKALGGILADRIGVLWTVVVPLTGSALLLWLAWDYMVPGLIAVLLFQTTMPITLALMYRQTPGHPGMAFGMLSFGLFLGSLPKTAFSLWEQKLGMVIRRFQVAFFLQDHYKHIGSVVAVVSLLLLLTVFFLWKHAWKGKSK